MSRTPGENGKAKNGDQAICGALHGGGNEKCRLATGLCPPQNKQDVGNVPRYSAARIGENSVHRLSPMSHPNELE